jgi:hypothetical protein
MLLLLLLKAAGGDKGPAAAAEAVPVELRRAKVQGERSNLQLAIGAAWVKALA